MSYENQEERLSALINGLGSRFAEERKRLKLTQVAASGLCKVRREMIGRYESGDSIPGGEVLCAFADAGADVSYIVRGIRSAPLGDDRLWQLIKGLDKDAELTEKGVARLAGKLEDMRRDISELKELAVFYKTDSD